MRLYKLSVKRLCQFILLGNVLSMLIILGALYSLTKSKLIIICGVLLIGCCLLWFLLLVNLFSNRLSIFTSDICKILDNMINGNEVDSTPNDHETLFSRIITRLMRLYEITKKSHRIVEDERHKLQSLVTDISHQVKIPISNIKMITDTLLTKSVTTEEQTFFLESVHSQTEKLDFLFHALVKTSRLETGIIKLEKKDANLYETLAQSISAIIYDAEKKNIDVTIDCPDDLHFFHDSKWTSEALFNILDNAVKYTLRNGKIKIIVEQWEMYIKIDIIDTGKGISEKNHATIFQRFFREEDVHEKPGIGIGLYLSREIITQQGGYIKVSSELKRGSTFSTFLPIK